LQALRDSHFDGMPPDPRTGCNDRDPPALSARREGRKFGSTGNRRIKAPHLGGKRRHVHAFSRSGAGTADLDNQHW
jgi:hypothetical protein